MTWKLSIGIINNAGSILSRDSYSVKTQFDNPEKLLESLEDCQSTLNGWLKNYQRLSYKIDWVVAFDPDGNQHKLK